MKILIDNGHGIDTPGKRSPDGALLEYVWNRMIAARIVTALQNLGHDAQLLVPERKTSPLPSAVAASMTSAAVLAPATSSLSPSTPTPPEKATAGTMSPAGAPTPQGATPVLMSSPPASTMPGNDQPLEERVHRELSGGI